MLHSGWSCFSRGSPAVGPKPITVGGGRSRISRWPTGGSPNTSNCVGTSSWPECGINWIGNLSVIEAITRRLQLIEYQYRERAREAQRGGAQGGAASSTLTGLTVMGGEEADLFDGVGRLDSVVCVCPKLVDWISAELKKTADIDKAARKAREEKALARGSVQLEQPALLVNLPPATTDPKGEGKGKKPKR